MYIKNLTIINHLKIKYKIYNKYNKMIPHNNNKIYKILRFQIYFKQIIKGIRISFKNWKLMYEMNYYRFQVFLKINYLKDLRVVSLYQTEILKIKNN